jgi:hypothetical protein
LAHWLDQQESLAPVVARLLQAIEAYKQTHPDDDFALLQHREQTLLHRVQALFFAPLVGIETLTGCATHAHPVPTLLGRGDHSSTLTQLLGQLERINAAEALRPALVPATAGQITYVDGPMIASGSRVSMPKGKLTMLGRIMAGSPAVIAPNEAGHTLFVASYPPDIHVSQVLVASCHQVALATGTSLVVIDRAVNAVAIACAFDNQGLGLLSMLDENAHEGLDSLEAAEVDSREDGTRVYSGAWKVPRPDDPRHCVLVQPTAGTTLVYWGTPPVKAILETIAWPRVDLERKAIQAHSFKRMIDHGALHTNSGRKKSTGPDRHQQRGREPVEKSLEAAQKRVAQKAEARKAPQDKVGESGAKGPGKRLAPRQRALVMVEKERKDAQHTHAPLTEQAVAIGPPRERADRDFRTQTIMTVRTRLLENALMAFMVVLCGRLQTKVSLDCLLRILFERSGSRMVTASQVVYWVNTAGVSRPYRHLLSEVVDGLCAMELQDQGKLIRVRLKDMPP